MSEIKSTCEACPLQQICVEKSGANRGLLNFSVALAAFSLEAASATDGYLDVVDRQELLDPRIYQNPAAVASNDRLRRFHEIQVSSRQHEQQRNQREIDYYASLVEPWDRIAATAAETCAGQPQNSKRFGRFGREMLVCSSPFVSPRLQEKLSLIWKYSFDAPVREANTMSRRYQKRLTNNAAAETLEARVESGGLTGS